MTTTGWAGGCVFEKGAAESGTFGYHKNCAEPYAFFVRIV